jgi:DNA-binding Xre family transcriptional regulator
MSVKEAVVARFLELCDTQRMSLNELANISGVTPSTVYSMLDQSRRNVSITTIKKLCDGLNVTLGKFFSTSHFDDLEQEMI